MFGLSIAAYFDDYCICEPRAYGTSGKGTLRHLHEKVFGIPLAVGPKDVPPRAVNSFLGVLTDLSRFESQGTVTLKPKPERIEKFVRRIRSAINNYSIPHAECASLCGKLEFTLTAAAGRVGRAALASLYRFCNEGSGAGGDLTIEAEEALRFFFDLLPRLPPRVVRYREAKRRPVVIWTDASYSRTSAAGCLGLVLYDPEVREHVSVVFTAAGVAHVSIIVVPERPTAKKPDSPTSDSPLISREHSSLKSKPTIYLRP